MLLSKLRLRYVDMPIILHLRKYWRANSTKVLWGLESSQIAHRWKPIKYHRLTTDGLFAGRRLRKQIALIHARCLRFETRTLARGTTTVNAENLALAFGAPVTARHPGSTMTQLARRYQRPGTSQGRRSDETRSSSKFS